MESKKTERADLTKKSGLFLSIGMVITLAIVITAFKWPEPGGVEMVNQEDITEDMDEMLEVPPTEQPPPPPPKIQQPKVIEVPDEEEIEEEIEIDFDTEIEEDEVIEVMDFEEPEEEVAQTIFTIVEDPAEPKGGYAAFFKYVADEMDYPTQARRMGIEGKVYVQFVVDTDGSITEVTAVRGIGAGCDEEAVRVLKNAPKWNPPKQRGQAVKQRIVLPIVFKLN